jgi:hypothetical protein
MFIPETQLRDKVRQHPRPLLFATISGAHLYGFPSPDSDFDLRGAHILSVPEVIGLDTRMETIELTNKVTRAEDGIEFDVVTHDIKKFFTLLLKKNGYVLEQLYSPLVVHSTPEFTELKSIAHSCITRQHAYHYLGFAETQWKLFNKESPHRIKPLLYVYRVLLTGIHLMQTGLVEANLAHLNEQFKLPYVTDLIALKRNGSEHAVLPNSDMALHQQEYVRLVDRVKAAYEKSSLPEGPTARPALNDLLIRLRLAPPALTAC